MKAHGKVLREPNSGPGLLMIDGRQFRFFLDGIWHAEALPRRGLEVEVELDRNLQVTGITTVPESQIARDHARAVVETARDTGAEIVRHTSPEFEVLPLIAASLLLVGWFSLTTLTIAVPFVGKINLTFWQLLGLVNSPNVLEAMERSAYSGAGIYVLFAGIALSGPFLRHFSKNRCMLLGGLAPLVFMLVIWIMARNSIQSAFAPKVVGLYADLARGAPSDLMQDVSFGFGAYFTGLVGAYFAWTVVRQFSRKRQQAGGARECRTAA